MKSYYNMINELKLEEIRLETLKEKKELLEANITSCTSKLEKEQVKTSGLKDKIGNYVCSIDALNNQIDIQQKIVDLYKSKLDKMTINLKNLTGVLERVFYLYYKEKKSVVEISMILNCSDRNIYYYLKEIKKILNEEKEAM